MKRPMDHLPPRRALGDVRGASKGEKASEYFDFTTDPDKAGKRVTRAELLFWLSRQWLINRERRWYRRLWHWLRQKPGAAMTPVGEQTREQLAEAKAAAAPVDVDDRTASGMRG